MNRLFKGFSIVSTILMFLVMIAGTLVTNTDSAQGCGSDWPLCNGRFVPEYTLQSFVEYTHRLVTGIAGIAVIVFAIWAWRRYRGDRTVAFLALFGCFFIILESLLGAAAVLWPQSPPVLALHFGFSLLAFTGVCLLTVYTLQIDRQSTYQRYQVSGGFRKFLFFVVVYTYATIYSGAFVRHSGASLVNTSVLGSWNISEWFSNRLLLVQMLHRSAAGLLFVFILIIFFYARRTYRFRRPDIVMASTLSVLFVILQIAAGIYAIKSNLHIYSTVLHSTFITLLFATLSYLCMQSIHKGTIRR
ncbi:heme A synthase [Fodinisporobacter ferrooxydans]|uniref:Heme A synthase n=1 Tax=Fodinisporobacter ferrooxydans TaxID=2901836 RepID=A0ABY4CGA0_9BACL|nr:heme A synthase [Alicyclobacillaceae bacterium MYW30-H2]